MANGAEDAAADEVLELERARCAAISDPTSAAQLQFRPPATVDTARELG